MRVEVEIERLVLEGPSAAEGRALAAELERELGRLLGGGRGGEVSAEPAERGGRSPAYQVAARLVRDVAPALGPNRVPAPARSDRPRDRP